MPSHHVNGFGTFRYNDTGITDTNGMGHHNMSNYPPDVGIIDMYVYFPAQYVSQTELEKYDYEQTGENVINKYTIGLGQRKMGFCTDREDVNSLCLTALNELMKRTKLDYSEIGYLAVGTESSIDKSKSVKSVLMDLFTSCGNHNVEGVDNINACYGGTAALFSAINWMESSYWNGKYAVVLAGDIAVYASGKARPTGGAGAVAVLIGCNAAVAFERGMRASHMSHNYDFYKPNMASEYPVVDGKLSIQCYLQALDSCYWMYNEKAKERGLCTKDRVNLSFFDFFAFHSPYCKLVQKSFARLFYNDCNPPKDGQCYEDVKKERNQMAYDEKSFILQSKELFDLKTDASLLLAREVGNMYTPSVYGGLASIIATQPLSSLINRRIGLFSYGSGSASSMFSMVVRDTPKLATLQTRLREDIERLELRREIPPADFERSMKIREENHHSAPYTPNCETAFFGSTFCLSSIDDMQRRMYKQVNREPAASLLYVMPTVTSNSVKTVSMVGTTDRCETVKVNGFPAFNGGVNTNGNVSAPGSINGS